MSNAILTPNSLQLLWLNSVYRTAVSSGVLMKCNYAISLSPYLDSGLLSSTGATILSAGPDIQMPFGNQRSVPVWLLATECDCPVLEGSVESARAGNGQINRLVGQESPSIPVTFLETANADILNSLQAIASCQFNDDGTQNPPAQYAMWLSVSLFDRNNPLNFIWTKQFLVGVERVERLGLSASERTPLYTSASFCQLSPFRR